MMMGSHTVGLKRYCAWATEAGLLDRDPARVVKLIPQVKGAPRHLQDGEEQALLAAVIKHGPVRDQTIITVLLHTGLRAHELCGLQIRDVTVNKRSGVLRVRGKRNKYREVLLNSTARDALTTYLATIPHDAPVLFCSHKTGAALTERALGYLIAKYADLAKVADVSPHDLRHRFGYRMAALVPLHRLAQIMGHDSLDTTMIYVQGTKQDLQQEVEKIAWA
jgi:integrase/recombinase XerC